jgi:hypothetical protein
LRLPISRRRRKKPQRIIQTWYEAIPYCCGFIFLFKDEVSVEVEAIVPITPVEFFERANIEPRLKI